MLSPIIIEAIGVVAGLLTTVAYLPQVIKVWRSRSARDISLAMFLLMNAGIALWLTYGLLIGSPGLILANGATLCLTAAVLVGKLKFDPR